jgi:hypothetical protein
VDRSFAALFSVYRKRRRRDSNPCNLSVNRFSKPAHSAALPLLREYMTIITVPRFGVKRRAFGVFLALLGNCVPTMTLRHRHYACGIANATATRKPPDDTGHSYQLKPILPFLACRLLSHFGNIAFSGLSYSG